MYHRVADLDVDPWQLCVTPERFSEQLARLNRLMTPLSLTELVKAHQNNAVPDRAVVVTFDDGYANNLHWAKPLLLKHQIPATVFVTTGYLEQSREFWWDELDQLLLRPGTLPQSLRLIIQGQPHQWLLGDAAHYSEANYLLDCSRSAHESTPGSRLEFYRSVWQALQPLTPEQRLPLLTKIQAWTEAPLTLRPSHRPLNLQEVLELEAGGTVTVGAHTVSHPLLSAYGLEAQRQEILHSKAMLETLLNHPVQNFAYPFGIYDQPTISLVQTAGFTCACSTHEESVWHKSDRYQLPRFGVQNWSGAEFEHRIQKWFGT